MSEIETYNGNKYIRFDEPCEWGLDCITDFDTDDYKQELWNEFVEKEGESVIDTLDQYVSVFVRTTLQDEFKEYIMKNYSNINPNSLIRESVVMDYDGNVLESEVQ